MIKKQLDKAITDYLKTENTSYAILLTGKWGSGKTYYWKNYIKPELVEKTKIIGINEKNDYYRPIYISLYGIESIEEISKRIFLELLPKAAKTKAAKIISVLGAKVMSAASSFFSLGDLDLDYEKLNEIYKLNECVLTFDDLERISNDENLLDKILGYINYMSEHEGIKIIILTNENQLEEQFPDKWNISKEKIINQSIPFIINYSKIIDQIIDSFAGFESYHGYLKENASIIKTAFNNSNTNNLRTLKYSLERLLKLYSLFEDNYKQDFFNKNGENILYYLIIVSFEHKKGEININSESFMSINKNILVDLEIFKHANPDMSDTDLPKENKTEDKIYNEKFIRQYYNNDYIPLNIPELFKFILTGLYDNNLVEKLEESFIPENKDEMPQVVTLNNLRFFHNTGISDKELKISLKKVLDYAVNGDYHIMYYPIIYNLILNLNELKLISYDIEKVKIRLLKGIKKANQLKKNVTVVPFLEETINDLKHKDKQITETLFQLIENNKIKHHKKQAYEFMRDMEHNRQRALDRIYKREEYNPIDPLFKYLPIGKLFKLLYNKDNRFLIKFNQNLQERFQASSDHYKSEEKDSLLKLKKKIESYVNNRKQYDIKLFHLEYIIRNINRITE